MGWGVGLVIAGIGLFSVFIVFMAIGAFDQWHIQNDTQLTLVFSVPVLMAVVGLILIVVGLVKAFRAPK
ncbi:hypothetical protein BAR24066_04988 [Burkholderia arboris]|uniref:Uncharacterized protein n=1 Tax=Burkholderia arboris TaxID=488730 RepID=A0A9Q9USS4_9BURK|nr:hypothetical protein [Burkholderia arboris]VWC04288.1 hypothetical protein BAR24066_04988 [Burkholderia arboris]